MLASLHSDGFLVAATEQMSLVLKWQLWIWLCPHAAPVWPCCDPDDPWGSASWDGGDGEQQVGDLARLQSSPYGFLLLCTLFLTGLKNEVSFSRRMLHFSALKRILYVIFISRDKWHSYFGSVALSF